MAKIICVKGNASVFAPPYQHLDKEKQRARQISGRTTEPSQPSGRSAPVL